MGTRADHVGVKMTNKLADMTTPHDTPAPVAAAAPVEVSAAPVYEPPASQPKPETAPSAQRSPSPQTAVAKTPTNESTAESGPIPFVPASSFEGARKGFFFSMGDQGLGYYRDLPLETRLANRPTPPPEERPRCMDQI